MSTIGYQIAKIKSVLLRRNNEVIINYFRRCGCKIGTNTHIFSDISGGEPYLIEIGNNVTISNNVSLITHDASVSKVISGKTDVFGNITIGNNVFIGMGAIILPGVGIADNTIVAAGSVVTKSVCEENCIIAGNPGKKVGEFEQFREKCSNIAVNIEHIKNKKDFILSCEKIIK